MSFMKRLVNRFLRKLGYELVSMAACGIETLTDLSEEEKNIVLKVQPFTMTGVQRVASLVNAINYIAGNDVPGDVVECGVWRGGSMMAVALALMAHRDTSRSLYLFDTFEGMPAPAQNDKRYDGRSAQSDFEEIARGNGQWCYASIEDVRENIYSTGYPKDKIHFVKGKVEETIPGVLPSHLCLLRLDTDWYESTKHELKHLFPLLDSRGILIVDDYGYWQGARQAVDEYFQERKAAIYLHRIDSTGRALVKGDA